MYFVLGQCGPDHQRLVIFQSLDHPRSPDALVLDQEQNSGSSERTKDSLGSYQQRDWCYKTYTETALKRSKLVPNLDTLFDIARENAEDLILRDTVRSQGAKKDVLFLNDQKRRREMCIDADDVQYVRENER